LKGKVMASILLALLVALSPITSFTGTQSRTFNPTGYFIPKDSQRNLSKVRWILLSDYYTSGRKGPMHVELRIGTEERWTIYPQSSLRIFGDNVTFRTKARKGVSYEFRGRLFPNKHDRERGQFEDSPNALTVLRGELKTKRNNQVIRSEMISFYYTAGD
jgi:hypothetical protein